MKPMESMKRRARSWLYAGAVAAGLLLLLVTRLQWPSLQMDWVEVPRPAVPAANTYTVALDEVLLANAAPIRRSAVVRQGLDTPYQVHTVGPFSAQPCEVSQGQFAKFLQWRGVYPEQVVTADEQPPDWVLQSSNQRHRVLGRLDVPVSGVSYYEAYAYCASAGGQLPSHAQHLAMVNGTSQPATPAQRLYPWGNQPNGETWPYIDPVLNVAQQCTTHPQFATPAGVNSLGYGMVEWLQADSARPDARAPLAGSYPQEIPHALYSLNLVQRQQAKTHRSDFVGFRCVWEGGQTAPYVWPWENTPVHAVPIAPGAVAHGVRDSQVAHLLNTTALDSWSQVTRQLRRFRAQKTIRRPRRPLRVARCEVSRAQYRLFLLDPLVQLGFYQHPQQPAAQNHEPLQWQAQLQAPSLPVFGVDWWSAQAFAKWVGGRLPSADEWVDIASDYTLKVYLWGNDYTPEAANMANTGDRLQAELQPCATDEADFTTARIADMAGNLSEWSNSTRQTARGIRVQIKGGNYYLPGQQSTRLLHSRLAPPEYRSPSVGLRVVFD